MSAATISSTPSQLKVGTTRGLGVARKLKPDRNPSVRQKIGRNRLLAQPNISATLKRGAPNEMPSRLNVRCVRRPPEQWRDQVIVGGKYPSEVSGMAGRQQVPEGAGDRVGSAVNPDDRWYTSRRTAPRTRYTPNSALRQHRGVAGCD